MGDTLPELCLKVFHLPLISICGITFISYPSLTLEIYLENQLSTMNGQLPFLGYHVLRKAPAVMKLQSATIVPIPPMTNKYGGSSLAGRT